MTTKTKPKFKKHLRFDPVKAETGVPHHIIDENGNDYGTWIISLYDPYNKYVKTANERFEREFGNDPRFNGKNAGIFSVVNVLIQGWENVVDEDDKPIPFSRELAFDILSDPDNTWLADEIWRRSRDVTEYRAITPAATQEEDAGN